MSGASYRLDETYVKVARLAELLDKLSERLAFERAGTRPYEALINEVEVMGENSPGPALADLRKIRDKDGIRPGDDGGPYPSTLQRKQRVN